MNSQRGRRPLLYPAASRRELLRLVEHLHPLTPLELCPTRTGTKRQPTRPAPAPRLFVQLKRRHRLHLLSTRPSTALHRPRSKGRFCSTDQPPRIIANQQRRNPTTKDGPSLYGQCKVCVYQSPSAWTRFLTKIRFQDTLWANTPPSECSSSSLKSQNDPMVL